jgi:glycosyltransferase involved in cell wall biosynthesis
MGGEAETKKQSRKLALLVPSIGSVLRLRQALVRQIAEHHRVLVLAPAAEADDIKALIALGVEYRAFDLSPPGLTLLQSFRAVRALREIYRDWQPDIAMAIGSGPLVMNAIAAKRQKVARIVSQLNDLPECLGETVEARGGPSKAGIKSALAKSTDIVFHNHDHPDLLRQQDLLPEDVRMIVIPGAGVDLDAFPATPLPALDDGLTFFMAARRDLEKGVADYAAAARHVANNGHRVRFAFAGPPGHDDVNLLDLGFSGEVFRYTDQAVDIASELANCHVYVYPSHSEGMPPSVLQALASGRPVITTDTPGCRETVDEKINGCLFPRGNIMALVDAIESILRRPDLIAPMGRASRLKAERRFDQRSVNRRMLQALGL